MNSLKLNLKALAMTLAMLVLGTAGVCAADMVVKGTVSDSAGEPLIGASVIQKGTTNGVQTDIDGKFQLKVPEGATILFTYVGYVAQELKAAPEMNVVMTEDAEMLSEVVAIGYGTQKKSVVTASIAQVSADELEATAPVRVDNALKGLASGVSVTSASGQPACASVVSAQSTIPILSTLWTECP